MNKRIAITSFISICSILCACNNSGNKNNKCVVTLNPNGGSISTTKLEVESGTLFTSLDLPSPTKNNYIFSHWTFNDDNRIPIESSYMIDKDITFKAQYDEAVTVTFNTDGGNYIEPKKIAKGTLFATSLFQTPIKQGYKFKCWLFSNGSEISSPYLINEDVTLLACYDEYESADDIYIKSLNVKHLIEGGYLHEATYSDLDYELGCQYFENYYSDYSLLNLRGGCSSFCTNGIYARNLEWIYDDTPEVIMHTKKTSDRHATLSIAFAYGIKNSDVGTTNDVTRHKLLPFITTDGINDAGLVASMNELDKYDVGTNSGSNPGKKKISNLMLVRYLLDYASSIEECKTLLNEISVFNPTYMNDLHIMLADAGGNVAILEFEPEDGILSNKRQKKVPVFYTKDNSYFANISTNFTFTNYMGDSFNWTHPSSSLTNYAQGVERYNILYNALYSKNGTTIDTLDKAIDLLDEVRYSKTYSLSLEDYSDTFWFSEFNYGSNSGNNCKTTEHLVSNYLTRYNSYNNAYVKHKRNSNFYKTKHSVAYDIAKKKMKLKFEETTLIDKEFSI